MGETGCSNDDQVFIIDDDYDESECGGKTPERNDQANNVNAFSPINKDSEPEMTNAVFEQINST